MNEKFSMNQTFGHLIVNEIDFFVQYADCSVFIGHLRLGTITSCGDLDIFNVPFGSAVAFEQLDGESFSCVDCGELEYENPLLKPAVYFQNQLYSIRSIDIAAEILSSEVVRLVFQLTAMDPETGSALSTTGAINAEFNPINSWRLLRTLEPIPIRFASYYLPIIGLPPVPKDATLSDITRIFGPPTHQGGGLHPQIGMIPMWLRYTMSNCFVRFQFEDELATDLTIMSLDDPPCDLVKKMG